MILLTLAAPFSSCSRASASRASVPSISSVRLNMAGCCIRGKVYQNSARADNTQGHIDFVRTIISPRLDFLILLFDGERANVV